ncbi:MAG: hypothetical protein LBK58_04100 [Prevotellaceae bacterium]|jgi:hypothetical protein|nr:hypothetical protein [Prevotellaceae bacterium]
MKKILLLMFVLIPAIAKAQDRIVTRSGDTLHVEVVKNAVRVIEFLYPGETAVNEINKGRVAKIIFGSGREEILYDMTVPDRYRSKKSVIELDFTYGLPLYDFTVGVMEADLACLYKLDYLLIGAGVGLGYVQERWDDNGVMYSAFGRMKIRFRTGIASGFISLDAGYRSIPSVRMSGVYSSPSIGYDIPAGRTTNLVLKMGVIIQSSGSDLAYTIPFLSLGCAF